METRTTRRRRLSSGLLAGALLLVPMAACGDSSGSEDAAPTPDATATESAPAEETGGSTETAGPEDTAGADGPEETAGATDGTDADVQCSGSSCSVSLSGDGASAQILGVPVVLGGVENGQATFRVGEQELTCGQGESVSAGPLTLACETVTEDAVTMTASLG
ncbi:hypothetical protein [Geodermatophilus sp. SYSU D00684]